MLEPHCTITILNEYHLPSPQPKKCGTQPKNCTEVHSKPHTITTAQNGSANSRLPLLLKCLLKEATSALLLDLPAHRHQLPGLRTSLGRYKLGLKASYQDNTQTVKCMLLTQHQQDLSSVLYSILEQSRATFLGCFLRFA